MAKGHKDKVAVITGAANGIGQAFAKRLAEDGVHIVIADIGDGGRDRQAGRSGRPPGACCQMRRGVASSRSPPWPSEVDSKFGRCDILVNCAGIFPQQEFDEMTFADWRQVLSINLDGTFWSRSAFVPGMRSAQMGPHRQHGVVDLGSVVTGFAHYIASKGGMIGLHPGARDRARAARHHRQRHRAGPDPHARRTGARRRVRRKSHGGRIRGASPQAQAIPRVEVPDDLVGTISFLTSDDAAFITGQTLNVDGGRVRRTPPDLRRLTRPVHRAMRRLLRPLLDRCSRCVFLFEAWLWDHLEPLVAWVGRPRSLAAGSRLALARLIERLPPWATFSFSRAGHRCCCRSSSSSL